MSNPRLSNATEQCSEQCSSIGIEQCVEYIHGRTVRNGLTKKGVQNEIDGHLSNAREQIGFSSRWELRMINNRANRYAVATP